eukprot:jgi/Botrbrau1/10129/Bobra.0191s0002.1
MDFPYEYDFGNNVVWPFDCYVLGHAFYDFPFHVDGWRCSATMLCSSFGLRSYVRPCRCEIRNRFSGRHDGNDS